MQVAIVLVRKNTSMLWVDRSRKSSSSLSWYSYLQYFGKISIAIGQRKLLREQMYWRTDEETMYCSVTKISIQSVIGITNNFEALCTSLLRHYPWYTRRTWIEPQSAVTGISVGKYAYNEVKPFWWWSALARTHMLSRGVLLGILVEGVPPGPFFRPKKVISVWHCF